MTLATAMGTAVLKSPRIDILDQVEKYNKAARSRSLLVEERAVLTTLRQLKKGKKVIDLYRVFKQVASDHIGRPKLALANAAWKWCHYRRERNMVTFRGDSNFGYGRSGLVNEFKVPPAFMAGPVPDVGKQITGRAVVPMIPANLLPASPLREFHILFEAEWQDVPVDPILLQNIKGTNNLFVVLAHWNLTETERSVLAGRFDQR